MNDRLDDAIEHQENRIADLESKIGANGVDDMYLADKINYHLGVLSGLRHALTLINLEDEL